MAMDIRPNPLGEHSSLSPSDPRGFGKFSSDRRLGLIVFGVILVVVIVFGFIWIVLGAPGAPETVKRSIGGLPVAGNRDIKLPLIGEEEKEPEPPAVGQLTGLPCEHPTRRPIGVMLASDPVNRPVSGFSFADAVFELPVLTNNVTRLLAIFQCQEPREIGSVRSARHDYLFLARGVDAVIAHWGGSYWALNMIRNESQIYDSLSALGAGQQAFFRKSNLPAPYNGFTSYERLWNALQKVGYRTKSTFAGYGHVDEAPRDQRGSGTLDVGYPGVMRVRYVYNPELNVYERFWGGVRHFDAIDNTPVNPKVVVVAQSAQRLANGPGGYNDVDVEGSGKATVYQNGQAIEGTWEKSVIHKQYPFQVKDASGNAIPFVRGQLWVHFVDQNTATRWTPGPSAPPELDSGKTPTNLGG